VEVQYFRARRPGPEAIIENAVAERVPDLFQNEQHPLWMAGSLPIGAGMPDLVVVSCAPQVFALSHVEMPTPNILAYLRAVGRARLETIASRMGHPRELIIRCLNGLVEVEAVANNADTFFLSPNWRDILPEIVTIEAKVANWQKAVEQANRNRIFAHRSFIALPEKVAMRVKSEQALKRFGVGLLSVNDHHEVSVVRRARRHRPRVWTYYYQLASLVANHLTGFDNALHRTASGCSSRVP
jgi:hypothetical protein